MTLKEIIEEIENHTYSSSPVYGIDDDVANNIITALKIGQAMAEAGRYLQKQVDTHRAVYVKHYYDEYKEAVVLLAAWDAATKAGDV